MKTPTEGRAPDVPAFADLVASAPEHSLADDADADDIESGATEVNIIAAVGGILAQRSRSEFVPGGADSALDKSA